MTSGARAAWVADAGRLLAHLGFTLYHAAPDLPHGGADLFVAIRSLPTLEHFDPERIEYWVAREGRGRRATMGDQTKLPLEAEFEWGEIVLVDRLGERNEFLSFGGWLVADRLDEATLVARFRSAAPILRGAGHSQGVDPLTDDAGAFFGRLMVPIDFAPGAEARVAAAEPLVLYAVFVQDVEARLSHHPVGPPPDALDWARSEAHRLERSDPAAWDAGLSLRRELGLPVEGR